MSHVERYLSETTQIAMQIDSLKIEAMAQELSQLYERGGRLWIVGLGGSAANASHAANDFRKLCGIEAYCLTDNVAELTARANDEGWRHALRLQWANDADALLVLSVGGGSEGVSMPLIEVLDEAKDIGMTILGIVGRDGGHTSDIGDCIVIVPTIAPERVTPHTESWQSVILHCLVSHPDIQRSATKW